MLNLIALPGKGGAVVYGWNLEDTGAMAGETDKGWVSKGLGCQATEHRGTAFTLWALGKASAIRPCARYRGAKHSPVPPFTVKGVRQTWPQGKGM